MWRILIPLVPAALVAVVLARTLAFKPRPRAQVPAEDIPFDRERAVEHFRQMIRCRTVSSRDASQVDTAEFDRFRSLLEEAYPRIHGAGGLRRVGKTGLLYRIAGREAGDPTVFMAHYDVVSANEKAWKKPPFAAEMEDGVIWGRGTIDTKGTLLGVMEAMETLLEAGFIPRHDVYLSFSGDEEIAGPSTPAIVEELAQQGIRPALVLDEGGAVVRNVFPGVSVPCAVVGTGEKGMTDLEFSVSGNGGHASTPPPHTLVGRLARACVAVEGHPFPMRMSPPAAEMFDTLGRHSSFALRMVFANLWLFRPVLDMLGRMQGGEMNALMRTTVAFTQMEGSRGSNVLPPEARMVANLRIAGGETVQSVITYLRKVIRDDGVKIRVITGGDPSAHSVTHGPGWEKLTDAIAQTWPEAIVSPYLMLAASDSRHYCRISDCVYRFSAMELTKEERGLIHGNDERIPAAKVMDTVAFYLRLMRKC